MWPGAWTIHRLPSPRKSIAWGKGPKGIQGPIKVCHLSVTRSSGSKNRPSHKEVGSAKCPGVQNSRVPGPNQATALRNVRLMGRQWSK